MDSTDHRVATVLNILAAPYSPKLVEGNGKRLSSHGAGSGFKAVEGKVARRNKAPRTADVPCVNSEDGTKQMHKASHLRNQQENHLQSLKVKFCQEKVLVVPHLEKTHKNPLFINVCSSEKQVK